MAQEDRSFLGRGWKFPPQFSKQARGAMMNQGSTAMPATVSQTSVLMVEEEDDIKESLIILLSTRLGERVMRSDYGCNLDVLLFDSMTVTFLTYVREHIRESIQRYEPRIDLQQVIMDTSSYFEGKILITIEYIISSVNKRDNIVYPFYLKEGTNVERSAFPQNF
ncbi:MAG: GPW/gp25 family protein [Saprospiraceae bacterium]